MSEIKGQLLGIILVVMVFVAVGGVMIGAFRNFGSTITSEVTSAITEVAEE